MFKFLRRKESFEPAIYYEKLPKRFDGKVEPIKAVRASQNWGQIYPIEGMPQKKELKGLVQRLKRWNKKELENKIIKLTKSSQGDLVLIDKMIFSICDITYEKGIHNEWCTIKSTMSANGYLYKSNGVETCFEED